MPNQNPEQVARDNIDAQLRACGWVVQKKSEINLAAGMGVAVREYQTDVGPADYVLFVEKKPVGVIEAKAEDMGYQLTVVEEQSADYAKAKLKYPEIYALDVGESVLVDLSNLKAPYSSVASVAYRMGARLSVKRVENSTFRIKRLT